MTIEGMEVESWVSSGLRTHPQSVLHRPMTLIRSASKAAYGPSPLHTKVMSTRILKLNTFLGGFQRVRSSKPCRHIVTDENVEAAGLQAVGRAGNSVVEDNKTGQ